MMAKAHTPWLKLQRPISLRSHLILLVFATMIPLVIFSAGMVIRLTRDERETFQRGALERTLALLTAVDSEIRGSITTLQALASSHDLDVGNLPAFHKDAARVLKSQPHWFTITLALPSSRQVADASLPFGSELSTVSERESFDQVLRTGMPAAGKVTYESSFKQPVFTVRIPVLRNGVIKYVLSAAVKPQAINALLSYQRLPPNWAGVVADGDNQIVARTNDRDRTVGRLAAEGLRAALARAPEGWFRDRMIEGAQVYSPYSRSVFSGWTVMLRIPAHAVEAQFRHSLFYVASFGVGFLVLGIALAWILSNHTAQSIGSLCTMADELGLRPKADMAHNVPSRITEIEAVREAFLNAARLVRERSEERDRVEAALREVSERLELAQEAANIGSFERNLVTNEVKWSASQEKLYGLTSAFPGGYEDWKNLAHPDDIAAVESAVRNSIASMSPVDVEFRIIRSDGATRWMATKARVFTDENGAPVRMLGVNIDITDRKLAEMTLKQRTTELQTMLDILPVGIGLSHDPRGDRITVNPSFQRMLGLSDGQNASASAPEHEQLPYRCMRNGKEIPGDELPMQVASRTGKEVRDCEFDMALANGKVINLMVSAAPLFDNDGKVRGAIGAHVDVTRLKRSEEALREADRAKDEFLAMLGHELRNPLGVISTVTQLLEADGLQDSVFQELRETVARQVRHMTRLVEDLLDISRITRGQIRLHKDNCNLTTIVHETIEDYRRLLEQRDLRLVLDISKEPLWLMGDGTRLAQILGNALHNAIKFTERGGTVTVSLTRGSEHEAVLTVRDTGIGMAPETLARAFDLFSQADDGLESRRSGLGLGLALVKGLVELHGGEVRASSAGIGHGSELTIRLPLTESRDPKPQAITEPAGAGARGYRILLIDDNVIGARVMGIFLTRLGHSVEIAHSGPEGIDAARRFQPEIVLCDIGLPEMDGYAVARALRREPGLNEAYIVAVSGYGQQEDRRCAFEAGFDKHLTKPVDLAEFKRLLASPKLLPTVTVDNQRLSKR